MKKLNTKGFFLSETIIVATVVTAVVTMLYATVIGLLGNYNKRSYYNSVSSLYAADNIRTLMYSKGIDYFVDKMGSNKYYSVTCADFADAASPGTEELCNFIYNYGTTENYVGTEVIDKVIFTKYDITPLKGFEDSVIKEGTTTDYIDTIPVVTGTEDYRIILILKERDIDEAKSKYWYTTLKVVRW